MKDEEILDNLIKEVFVNQQQKVHLLLKKHDLESTFIQVYKAVDQIENIAKIANQNYVGSLSSSFLININTRVEKIENSDEKDYLQYIIGELSKQILIRLIQKSNNAPKQVLNQISTGLKIACQLNNWNYEELNKVTKFDLLHTIAAKSGSSDLIKIDGSNEIYYYKWNGENKDLKELAYNLKDRKTIKSVGEFLKLFGEHNEKLIVRFKSIDMDFVIILFDELKKKKLITPKGNKAKQFTPIKVYGVDFDKKLLFKGEAKYIKFEIVKNKAKYCKLKENINKWIDKYKLKS